MDIYNVEQEVVVVEEAVEMVVVEEVAHSKLIQDRHNRICDSSPLDKI